MIGVHDTKYILDKICKEYNDLKNIIERYIVVFYYSSLKLKIIQE